MVTSRYLMVLWLLHTIPIQEGIVNQHMNIFVYIDFSHLMEEYQGSCSVFFLFTPRFLISNHKTTPAPITTRSRTATAVNTENTEPTVMANCSEFCCEAPGDTKEVGRVELGWRTTHGDSETNFPESSKLVQAVGVEDIYLWDVHMQSIWCVRITHIYIN